MSEHMDKCRCPHIHRNWIPELAPRTAILLLLVFWRTLLIRVPTFRKIQSNPLRYLARINRNDDNRYNHDNANYSNSVIMIVRVILMSMTTLYNNVIITSLCFGLYHFPYVWIIFSKANPVLEIPYLRLDNYRRNNFGTSPSITTALSRKELAFPIFVTGLAFYGPGIIDTVVIIVNPRLMASAGVWYCMT